MKLYLIITDSNYNWINKVEEKDNSYYEEYIKDYKWPNYDWQNGCCHNGESYLIDVDIFDFKKNYQPTSVSYEFKKWFISILREEKMNEILNEN